MTASYRFGKDLRDTALAFARERTKMEEIPYGWRGKYAETTLTVYRSGVVTVQGPETPFFHEVARAFKNLKLRAVHGQNA